MPVYPKGSRASFKDVTAARKAIARRAADVVDPDTEQTVTRDTTEREMVQGAQTYGPNLGARPDLDITPFLNRDRQALGRVIEPKKHTDAMIIDELRKKRLGEET